MDNERSQEISTSPANTERPMPNESQDGKSAGSSAPSEKPGRDQPTVLVRGEAVDVNSLAKQQAKDRGAKPKDKEKSPPKEISEANVTMQRHLPALDDDADIGAQKDQVVTRDGKADLAFSGTLVASAAPSSAPKGRWQEYRIYETSGGKHVFSKVSRSIYAEDQDTHEAEVFDPAPSSVPSQLLRSARDLTRSHPLTWQDAAASFFGYDPLAKDLYRKVSGKFEEHIS